MSSVSIVALTNLTLQLMHFEYGKLLKMYINCILYRFTLKYVEDRRLSALVMLKSTSDSFA